MEMIEKPKITRDIISIGNIGWQTYNQLSSKVMFTDVHLLIRYKPKNDAETVWEKLKYGSVEADLFEGKKILRLEFNEPEGRYILHGVSPVFVEKSAIWEGHVIKCKIDYFEILPYEQA